MSLNARRKSARAYGVVGAVLGLFLIVSTAAPASADVNTPPTVDAGPDAAGDVFTNIVLDGTVTDPDPDTVVTTWTVDQPGSCSFADPSAVDTTINCTLVGSYVATLTADDGNNPPVSESAIVDVTELGGGGADGKCRGLDPTPGTTSSFDSGTGITTITGTSSSDVIIGTDGPDVITGLGGNDVICSRDGNDTVRGGGGNDAIFGGLGDDRLFGDRGTDRVAGYEGNDTVNGNDDNDSLTGGGGNDRMIGGTGNDLVSGGDGKDHMTGGGGDDTVNGKDGNDHMWGGAGNDVLHGGDGDDFLDGGIGTDTCKGGGGTDTLSECP